MLVIIEGIDKSGKSTLIEYLIKNIPNTYSLKIGQRPKDNTMVQRHDIIRAYNKILNAYKGNFYDKRDILILDRFYLSELVYCIKRGYDALDMYDAGDEMRLLKEKIEMLDVVLILCRPDPKTVANNFIKEKEDYAVEAEIKTLMERYDYFFDTMKVEKTTYNYEASKLENVAAYIRKIKSYEDQAS